MKKSIIFSIVFFFCTHSIFAQKYTKFDFVGTWVVNNKHIEFKYDKTASIRYPDWKYSHGKWNYCGNYDTCFKPGLQLSFEGMYSNYEVLSVSDSQIKLKEYESGKILLLKSEVAAFLASQKSKPEKSTQSGNAKAAAGVILGLLLLDQMIGGSSDSGSSESTYDRNRRDNEKAREAEYEMRRRNGGY